MQISFLLGPAGSGKTFRCLSEIRNELRRNPEGGALILLAPKQATFQLERQLLEGDELKGYSRLQIFSFERLARFVLEASDQPLPRFISDQGRTMVLRALLNQLEGKLETFKKAARRHGFPQELGEQLREFTHHGLTPETLRHMAETVPNRNLLRGKLRDFALLLEHYRGWLREENLQDADALLGAAADLLSGREALPLQIDGLWLDGFAQLTPEERRLLVALLRYSERSTLAFCLDPEQTPRNAISSWYLVGQTVAKCRAEIAARYSTAPGIDALPRDASRSRFANNADLRHLEANWGAAAAGEAAGAVQLFECADAEAEAACCAREILRFVQAGGRFRESAVLLRDFNGEHREVLRRVFKRYGLPFFIDHREGVAHHPLAELTRATLRTIAYDWQHEDWFNVLKTGLVPVQGDELDHIETEALARGWQGAVWREGLAGARDKAIEQDFARWRQKIMPPFLALRAALLDKTTGRELAAALRDFWKALGVGEKLQEWSGQSAEDAVHATVWEQMSGWLEDVERAFAQQPLALRQWLPILEAGLSALTVGVIPPVLDEVVIGSVARSRNPDLKLLCILGFNERIFPAVPGRETLLTEDDRTALAVAGSDLANVPALQLAAEQFYGYIACTRARETLRITYARAGLDGKALNPSRFISQLTALFPDLQPVSWDYPHDIVEVVHRCELPMLGYPPADGLMAHDPEERLSPEIVARLYGDRLEVPVSALERFAACPFQFFVERGLRVREREEFDLDVREQGRFQHEVLARYHAEVAASGRLWRNLGAEEARALIGRIADEQIATFHDGLLRANKQNEFTAENYKLALQDFIETVTRWFETNDFDPALVEFAFGTDSGLPGWSIQLSNGKSIVIHGRVDRIDVCKISDDEALCIIMDYKSGVKEPKRILTHFGIQQQLTGYLVAITRVPEIAKKLGVKSLIPGGGFLVPLRAQFENVPSRGEIAADRSEAQGTAYTHYGLFDFAHLHRFDSKAACGRTGQFNYSLTRQNNPTGNAFNVLSTEKFKQVLQRTETLVEEVGTRIFEGVIEAHPFKGSGAVACSECRMQPVCRFDPWVQPYNRLKIPKAS